MKHIKIVLLAALAMSGCEKAKSTETQTHLPYLVQVSVGKYAERYRCQYRTNRGYSADCPTFFNCTAQYDNGPKMVKEIACSGVLVLESP